PVRNQGGDAADAAPVRAPAHPVEPGVHADVAQGRVEAAAHPAPTPAGLVHVDVPARAGAARAVPAGRAAHRVRAARPGTGRDAVLATRPADRRPLPDR